MELDIHTLQFADAALFHRFLAAPTLERDNHFAELRAVVAKMVNAYHAVTESRVQLVQTAADCRRGQVTDVERLADVYRAVVDADCLAVADCVVAVVFACGKYVAKRVFHQSAVIDKKVEIAVYGFNFGDYFVGRNFGSQLLCDGNGRHAHCLCQPEARKGVIAQLVVGNFRHCLCQFRLVHVHVDFTCNVLFVV